MAFNPALLVKLEPSSLFTQPADIPAVQPAAAPTQLWLYNANADTAAVVAGAGYFFYFADWVNTLIYNNGQFLQIGDLIYCHCADANEWLEVTAVAPVITTQIAPVSANSVDTAAIQNLAVTTAKIAANAVTLAKLSAGITPSHVIKFANQVTTVGGAAAEAFAVPGAVAATDRAFVQIVDNGAANVTALQAVVTADTLTVTFSADPGNDTVINYQIIRAAA